VNELLPQTFVLQRYFRIVPFAIRIAVPGIIGRISASRTPANTESCGQSHSSAAKWSLRTFNELRCGFGHDIGRSHIAAAQARSTDAPKIRRLRRIAARRAASAPQATRLTIFFGQKKRFRFASGTPDADASS
jgi:hypothetical protein